MRKTVPVWTSFGTAMMWEIHLSPRFSSNIHQWIKTTRSWSDRSNLAPPRTISKTFSKRIQPLSFILKMTPICWLFLRRAYWLPISLHRLNTTILLCTTRCIQGVKKYSNRRTTLLSPTTSTVYRIDESIPKAQMGYVFPSTSSNARVMHSRNPPQHYPKQHPTDCFDTLKYIQSMMKSETRHPQNSPL